jgi:hypothetical protein
MWVREASSVTIMQGGVDKEDGLRQPAATAAMVGNLPSRGAVRNYERMTAQKCMTVKVVNALKAAARVSVNAQVM